MPQALIAPVAWFLGTIGASTAFIVGASSLIANALFLGGLAALAYLGQTLFTPAKPQVPKPEDGKYNLKQNVPPLSYVLGRVKKGGDYVFLEERDGTAFHVMVHAAHRIKGFVEHYLHDEAVTLNVSGSVVTPTHFDYKVAILTRLGEAASTAYANLVGVFPEIWSVDHRGDGLASVMMSVESTSAENIQKTFPQNMPQHSAIEDGHDQIYDPRTGTYGFTTNLALFRLWHLTHPVGGKMTMDEMHLPDWQHAADVCDEWVNNRLGNPVRRYHGGFWFRANNGPVEVGRIMDEAAELVIYETPDGKVGVHAGEDVDPDIRLTADDIRSISFDPNMSPDTTVLAVRGQYTAPDKGYNTADAAIYGDPYGTDDERTKTFANVAIQDHNHCARKQAITFIRANAARVQIVASFASCRRLPYRRFITVHYPPMMTEAKVEILGKPVLSLGQMTYTFDGIIVPGALFAFDAATQEGEPGAPVVIIGRGNVPEPVNFTPTIQREIVSGGQYAAFASASVDFQNANFQYELEWQPTAGGVTQTVLGAAGNLTVRSAYLADGVQYRFRVRTWSVGVSSDWTDYEILTATADAAAPGVVTSVTGTGGAGQIAVTWTAPNSVNYIGARLYTNSTNTMTGATLRATEYGAPSTADSRTITGLAAGTYFGFVVAINGSGVAAAAVGTGSKIVT